MAHQASLRPGIATARVSPAPPGQPEGIIGNLAEFGEDVFTLAELQGKLAARDLNDCVGRAIWPLIVGSVAAVVVLGTVPVALLGVNKKDKKKNKRGYKQMKKNGEEKN